MMAEVLTARRAFCALVFIVATLDLCLADDAETGQVADRVPFPQRSSGRSPGRKLLLEQCVWFNNTCSDTAHDVALAYQTTKNKWISDGWYSMEPNDRFLHCWSAMNRRLYVHIDSLDDRECGISHFLLGACCKFQKPDIVPTGAKESRSFCASELSNFFVAATMNSEGEFTNFTDAARDGVARDRCDKLGRCHRRLVFWEAPHTDEVEIGC